jgi:thiamine-phosphate pyrophosphorylase
MQSQKPRKRTMIRLNQNPLICLITDRQTVRANKRKTGSIEDLGALIEFCSAAALAGVDLIQIREKDLSTNRLCDLVSSVVDSTCNTKTAILVNDRVDVALTCAAHGVQLRSDSLPVDATRKLAGEEFIVGVSTHSVAEARQAAEKGASFVLLGPIFDTPSKRAYGAPLGLETLIEAVRTVPCPVIALGGIDRKNIRDVLSCGAAGIAAIRLFSEAEDLSELINAIREKC